MLLSIVLTPIDITLEGKRLEQSESNIDTRLFQFGPHPAIEIIISYASNRNRNRMLVTVRWHVIDH